MNDFNRTNITPEHAEPVPARFGIVENAVRKGVLALNSMPIFAESQAFMPSVAAAPSAPISQVVDFEPTQQILDNTTFIEKPHQVASAEVVPVGYVIKEGTDFVLPEEQQPVAGDVVKVADMDQYRRIKAAQLATDEANAAIDAKLAEESAATVEEYPYAA